MGPGPLLDRLEEGGGRCRPDDADGERSEWDGEPTAFSSASATALSAIAALWVTIRFSAIR